jgi:lipopolysaccharide export system permease protein
MRDVSLFDLNDRTVRRVIYADSGRLAYEAGRTDLELRLFDGTIHEYQVDRPDLFQITAYRINTIKVRNVANSLDRDQDTSVTRGDREMTTCEMDSVVRAVDRDRAAAGREAAAARAGDLRRILRLPPTAPATVPAAMVRPSCGLEVWLERLLPKTAEAQVPAQHPARGVTPQGREILRRKLELIARRRADSLAAADSAARRAAERADSARRRIAPVTPISLTGASQMIALQARTDANTLRRNDFLVEIWKKWALSAACLIFALVGVPLALRFPRGGMGLVIGAGLGLFSLYYSALIGGEALGKRGMIPPFWSMWAPNLLLLVGAIVGIWRVNRESGSTRGGDFKDLLDALFGRFRRAR